jgi:hypothetical protein
MQQLDKSAFIKLVESTPAQERHEFELVPYGLSVTRGARDHYYYREGNKIAHIAHKFPGSIWKGDYEWSEPTFDEVI